MSGSRQETRPLPASSGLRGEGHLSVWPLCVQGDVTLDQLCLVAHLGPPLGLGSHWPCVCSRP